MLDDVWTGALEEEGGAREVVVLSVVVVVSAGGLWGCEDGVVSPELDGLASMSLERGMRKKKRTYDQELASADWGECSSQVK